MNEAFRPAVHHRPLVLIEPSLSGKPLFLDALHSIGVADRVVLTASHAEAERYLFGEGAALRPPPAFLLVDCDGPHEQIAAFVLRVRAEPRLRETVLVSLTTGPVPKKRFLEIEALGIVLNLHKPAAPEDYPRLALQMHRLAPRVG